LNRRIDSTDALGNLLRADYDAVGNKVLDTDVAAGFGFAKVHDFVRDQYDEGKITETQYRIRGILGGTVAVGVNAVGVAIGGAGGGVVAGSVVRTLLNRSVAIGVAATTTDIATQSVHISSGLQEQYDPTQTAIAGGLGATLPLVPKVATAVKGLAGEGVETLSRATRGKPVAVESSPPSLIPKAQGVIT
jgi:hypothetical protein